MATVAGIADTAIAAVKAAITDAFISANLIEPTQGAYNTLTGTYAKGETDHGAKDILFKRSQRITDLFPDYVAGPNDQLVLVRSTTAPQDGWVLRAGSIDYVIFGVQDILENGNLFNVLVREVT